jgi:branched-chain amino acid transport system ATP-binding protein
VNTNTIQKIGEKTSVPKKTLALRVSNLSVNYGPICALNKVSFEIEQGEIFAFLGANGAGKSTTMKALSGLIPYTGKIEFFGENICALPSHEIVKRGLIHCPEGRQVFATLTVKENIFFGAYARKITTKQIHQELEFVFELFPRLKERLNQISGTLSGGEQQMLAIARSLLSAPKLLCLDEPSLGIAPLLTQQIFQKISLLKEKGLTILLAEQNANQALKLSQNALVLEVGTVAKIGQATQLLQDSSLKELYLGG